MILQFMTGEIFMQLVLLLFLLLCGGKSETFKSIKPLLDGIGGEEVKSALEEAERISSEADRISSVITAVRAVMGGADGGTADFDKQSDGSVRNNNCEKANDGKRADNDAADGCEFAPHGFPLAPVAEIADEKILFCLSRYIALGD